MVLSEVVILSNKFQKPVLVAVLIGLSLSLVFLYISFITAIHDELRTAAYLFPIPVWINPDLHSLGIGDVLLAVIQWPLYGVFVALICKAKKSVAAFGMACLIVQHVLIGTVARAKVESVPVRMKLERDLPAESSR